MEPVHQNPCAPAQWDPSGANRICKSRGPAYGLSDAPADSQRTLRPYLLRAENSLAPADLKFQVSASRHCLYFVSRGNGGAVGALTAHIDNGLGCAEPDVLLKRVNITGAALGAWRHIAHVGTTSC